MWLMEERLTQHGGIGLGNGRWLPLRLVQSNTRKLMPISIVMGLGRKRKLRGIFYRSRRQGYSIRSSPKKEASIIYIEN